jgi:hypothetical protein
MQTEVTRLRIIVATAITFILSYTRKFIIDDNFISEYYYK